MIADPAPRHLDAVAEVDLAADRVRFRLRDMIVATTVFSVALALFKLMGLFGALFAFLTALGYTVYLKQSRLPLNGRGQALAQRRILNDFLWGVCMPIVCLVFDPVVFRNFGPPLTDYSWSSLKASLSPLGQLAYPALAFQLASMLIWLAAGYSLRHVAGFFAGVFVVGAVTAFAIGLCLLPLSFVGLFAMLGIGAMGVTPWFTGYAYFRRMRRAHVLGKAYQNQSAYRATLVAGLAAAIVIPLVTTMLLFGDADWAVRW